MGTKLVLNITKLSKRSIAIDWMRKFATMHLKVKAIRQRALGPNGFIDICGDVYFIAFAISIVARMQLWLCIRPSARYVFPAANRSGRVFLSTSFFFPPATYRFSSSAHPDIWLSFDLKNKWRNSGKICDIIKRRRVAWRHIYNSTIQVSKRKQTQSLGREQSHARPST